VEPIHRVVRARLRLLVVSGSISQRLPGCFAVIFPPSHTTAFQSRALMVCRRATRDGAWRPLELYPWGSMCYTIR